MTELDVRIVRLEPKRVAVAHGFGEHPEDQSWKKLMAFANTRGLLADLEARRFFGFNNPDPSPGSPNYGYESWITVGPDVELEGDITMHDFPGGLYAVTRCEGVDIIGDVWRRLVTWSEESPYRKASHQWLEEVLNPGDFVTPGGDPSPDDEHEKVLFDLYLPVTE